MPRTLPSTTYASIITRNTAAFPNAASQSTSAVNATRVPSNGATTVAISSTIAAYATTLISTARASTIVSTIVASATSNDPAAITAAAVAASAIALASTAISTAIMPSSHALHTSALCAATDPQNATSTAAAVAIVPSDASCTTNDATSVSE